MIGDDDIYCQLVGVGVMMVVTNNVIIVAVVVVVVVVVVVAVEEFDRVEKVDIDMAVWIAFLVNIAP